MIRLLFLKTARLWIFCLVFFIFASRSNAQEKDNVAHSFAEEQPQFPGGRDSMMTFIQKNLKYPANAEGKRAQGKVLVGFVVNENGSLADMSIVQQVSPELDEEALRIVSIMPVWLPGKQNGKAVKVKYVFPLNFKTGR